MKFSKSVINTMLFTFLIFAVVLAKDSSSQKIILNAGNKNAKPQLTLTESTNRALKFRVEIPVINLTEIEIDQQQFHKISIDLFSEMSTPGDPALPAICKFVAIPKGAEVNIQVSGEEIHLLEDVNIRPAQKPQRESQRENHDLIMNEQIYQQNSYYPEAIYVTEATKIVRGFEIKPIWITPVQFNPVERQVRIFKKFDVTINFVGGRESYVEPKYRSRYFTSLLERTIFNWDAAKQNINTESEQFEFFTGCDYLIITHDEFADAADTLANWRKMTGLKTKIVNINEIGTTAESIQNYIDYAYHNWNLPPSFILILGDAEFIPTNYVTAHSVEDNGTVGTDLYYATVDGSDYFPDIFIGRIPVDAYLEALVFIKKVINYERNPVADPGFYQQAAMAAYFQDDDDEDTNYNERDGYEDRRFVLTSEEIRDFLNSSGYQAERFYYAKQEVDPTNYNDGGYANGEPLPPDLLRRNGFLWNANASDINRALNNGAFILTHRDHGSRDGWGEPDYKNSDVKNLSNSDLLPVVFSLNCNTGWFDNETDDQITNTSAISESFCETWIRKLNGGAIGVFGSTRVSYSGYNDAIAIGFINAIWPQFLALNTNDAPLYQLGQVLNYGKLFMASNYNSSKTRQIEFEEFHYYGDPATSIWTQYPNELQVQAPDSCFFNQNQMTVFCDQSGVKITLLQNSQILDAVTTDENGRADLNFIPISDNRPLKLVAKKPNFKPHFSNINVYSKDQFDVVIDDIVMIDQNFNSQINVGETIQWRTSLTNKGHQKSNQLELKLICNDTLIFLNDSLVPIDSIGIGESITLTSLSFTVSQRCPDAYLSNMVLELSDGQNYKVTRSLEFTVFESVPVISVKPDMFAYRVNSLGDSVVTNLIVKNNGFGPLNFEIKNESLQKFVIGDPGRRWWASIFQGAGNVYQIEKSTNLKKFDCFLKINSPTVAHFFVYEGENITGTYRKIAESSYQINEITEDFFSSNELNVQLSAGKFYYLGVICTAGDAQICRADQMPPIGLEIGTVRSGVVNLGGNPPTDSIEQGFDGIVCFVQEIVTGSGDWLKLATGSYSLLPNETDTIKMTMKAVAADTLQFTNIMISSNDADRDSLQVPVYFAVGENPIDLVCKIGKVNDSAGNNDAIINAGESIILPIYLKNMSMDSLKNIKLTFFSADTFISIKDSLANIPILIADGEMEKDIFQFEVSPNCPDDYVLQFQLKIVADNNYSSVKLFELKVQHGAPAIEIYPDSLIGEIDILNDSLLMDIEITNNGYGNLIYQLLNPIQKTVEVGTPGPNWWLPLKNGNGNVYFQIVPMNLLAFRCLFQINSPSTIHFFVYEGDSLGGDFFQIAQSQIDVGHTGEQWIESGALDCSLKENYFYLIGTSWTGDAKISRALETVPHNTRMNSIQSGSVNLGGVPPDSNVYLDKLTPVVIAQRLIYGDGLWLSHPGKIDTILPLGKKLIPVKFSAVVADTLLNTQITITSNDPGDGHLYLPVRLNITALPAIVRTTDTLVPKEMALHQNYPNPFNASTEIQYSVSKADMVTIEIYNILGQKVKTLVSRRHEPGFYTIGWAGKNDKNQLISSGLYIVIMKTPHEKFKRKILLIK